MPKQASDNKNKKLYRKVRFPLECFHSVFSRKTKTENRCFDLVVLVVVFCENTLEEILMFTFFVVSVLTN